MTTSRTGCHGCAFDQWAGGVRVCIKKPFDMATSEQEAIARWLSESGRDAFRDPGCPGFATGHFTGDHAALHKSPDPGNASRGDDE